MQKVRQEKSEDLAPLLANMRKLLEEHVAEDRLDLQLENQKRVPNTKLRQLMVDRLRLPFSPKRVEMLNRLQKRFVHNREEEE